MINSYIKLSPIQTGYGPSALALVQPDDCTKEMVSLSGLFRIIGVCDVLQTALWFLILQSHFGIHSLLGHSSGLNQDRSCGFTYFCLGVI